MRLIEEDAVLLRIEEIKLNKSIPKNYGTLLDIMRKIRQLPTIDAEPVVHGHWIDQDSDCEDWHIHQYECSKCGMGDQHNPNINVPYCWFCGAKMDEDKKCEI